MQRTNGKDNSRKEKSKFTTWSQNNSLTKIVLVVSLSVSFWEGFVMAQHPMSSVTIDPSVTKCFFDLLNADSESDDEDNGIVGSAIGSTDGPGPGANRCLIMGDPLLPDHIQLPNCGHRFNYDSLLASIKIQKQRLNMREAMSIRQNEYLCPWCRCKHNQLLPHYPGKPILKGINMINERDMPILQCSATPRCHYKYGVICEDDGKPYCHTHMTQIVNKRIAEMKLKAKKEKEAIAEKKAAEFAAKKAENAAKKAQMEALVANHNAVFVNSGSALGCMHTFARGPRKGQMCLTAVSFPILSGDHLFCSRHKKIVGAAVGGGTEMEATEEISALFESIEVGAEKSADGNPPHNTEFKTESSDS